MLSETEELIPHQRTPRRRKGDDQVTNDDLSDALSEHAQEERLHYETLIANVMLAFPDGVDNHRRYHESKLAAARAEREFWESAKKVLIEKGVSGVLRLLGILLLLAVWGAASKYGIPFPPFLIGDGK